MTRPSSKPLAIIGPYELIERNGGGGMGSVYRARNNRDGRVIALKLMHEQVAFDLSYAERFRSEAAMEALIREPPGQYLWGYDRYKHPREGLV